MRWNYGLTEVTLDKGVLTVEHRGNMGNTVHDVRRNVDYLFGVGFFNMAQEQGVEEGTPDYLYTLTLEFDDA